MSDRAGFRNVLTDRHFKDELEGNRPTCGSFIQVGGPEVVEICGAVGLDFVILDTEHSPVGWERLSAMCLGALHSGVFPLIRVGTVQQGLVTRALDTGARGVVFPQIQSAEEATVAARACRYPPLGTRGAAGSRNMGWGVTTTLAEYIPAANDGVVCIIQIENRAGVERAMAIAAVPGVDCLFVGLSDLSVDLGRPAEYTHPDVEDALDAVIAAGRANDVAIGIPIPDTSRLDDYRRRGVSLFATSDRGIVAAGMAAYRSNF